MIPADIEALALADAVGALDRDEQEQLRVMVADLPADLQAQVAQLYAVAVTLADGQPSVEPPPRVRQQLLARIARPSRYTIPASEGDWADAGLPGLTMKVLAVDRPRGLVTLLVRGEPGARYPAHHHSGPEECYVIRGTVHVDNRVLGPGDFHHADAGSDHGELYTPDGAEVLIVGAIADYLPHA